MNNTDDINSALHDRVGTPNDKKNNAMQDRTWERESIHVGLYENEKQSIKKANQLLVKSMVRKIPKIKKSHKILNISSGYGDTARFLANKFNCKIDYININKARNDYNHSTNENAELDQFINIITGSINNTPLNRNNYNIVWSQESLSKSEDKGKALREISRVLQPEGRFIFTDMLHTKDCPEKTLKKINSFLAIDTLGTAKLYKRLARWAELERVYFREYPQQLVTHYSKVLKAVKDNEDELIKDSSKAAVQNRIKGLDQIIEAGYKGYLTWAIFQFQKRNI
jgi:sarcosine/dimethylglycine N-methyltransferase